MHRSMLLGTTMTLLLLAAVGMFAAAIFWQPPSLTVPSAEETDTVRKFYAAVNAGIASGDLAPLREVVGADFIDADSLPAVSSGSEGLAAYIMALHVADPGMRLVVEDLVADGDRVAARVGVRHGPGPAPLGGSIVDAPTPWGPVDIFRVAGGRIVARQSQTDELALIQPLATAAVDLTAPTPRVITLERVTLAPGARWDATAAGPRLLLVEQGVLQGAIGPPSVPGAPARADATRAAEATMRPGAPRVVPALAACALTNLGSGPARLLVVRFTVPLPPAGPSSPPPVLPRGVIVQTLAGDLTTRVGLGPVAVAVARVTLGRQADLALSSAAGPILLAVDTGRLTGTVSGTAWVRRGRDGMSAGTRTPALGGGDGLLLQPDGLVALSSDGGGPVTAVVVTLHPAPHATPLPS